MTGTKSLPSLLALSAAAVLVPLLTCLLGEPSADPSPRLTQDWSPPAPAQVVAPQVLQPIPTPVVAVTNAPAEIEAAPVASPKPPAVAVVVAGPVQTTRRPRPSRTERQLAYLLERREVERRTTRTRRSLQISADDEAAVGLEDLLGGLELEVSAPR